MDWYAVYPKERDLSPVIELNPKLKSLLDEAQKKGYYVVHYCAYPEHPRPCSIYDSDEFRKCLRDSEGNPKKCKHLIIFRDRKAKIPESKKRRLEENLRIN